MTFRGAFSILVLANRHRIFQAPLLFLWIVLVHYFFEIHIEPLTLVIIGTLIVAFQQFNIYVDDINDGFFDRCSYNGAHPVFYVFAKFLCEFVVILLPMVFILFFSLGISKAFVIFCEWCLLNIFLSCLLMISLSNPLKMLIAMLPTLATLFILLQNFLNEENGNNLLILIGYDIMLISIVCIVYTLQKK